MKGCHPLRSTACHFRGAVQFQTEPRAQPPCRHIHADGDIGDEVVHAGQHVRRRSHRARPFQPLQQRGNLLLPDALEENPERLRGARRESSRLEHVACFRQGFDDALDLPENPLVAAPPDGGGERREQPRGIPMFGESAPRPGRCVPRCQEDPGGRTVDAVRIRRDRTPARLRPPNGRGRSPGSWSVPEARPREPPRPNPVRHAPPRGCSVATGPIPGVRRQRDRRTDSTPSDGIRSRNAYRSRRGAAVPPGPAHAPIRRSRAARAGTGDGIPRESTRRCRVPLPLTSACRCSRFGPVATTFRKPRRNASRGREPAPAALSSAAAIPRSG